MLQRKPDSLGRKSGRNIPFTNWQKPENQKKKNKWMNFYSIIILFHLTSSLESTKSNNIKEIMFSILWRVGRGFEGCDRALTLHRYACVLVGRLIERQAEFGWDELYWMTDRERMECRRQVIYIQVWGEGAWLTGRVARSATVKLLLRWLDDCPAPVM